jgi:hypothetical protein
MAMTSVSRAAAAALVAALAEPFPQRDLHIRGPVPVILQGFDAPRAKGPGAGAGAGAAEDRRRPPPERAGGPAT